MNRFIKEHACTLAAGMSGNWKKGHVFTEVIRIITALAGTAGIFVFILPVFTGRILNIGNMTGLAVSLVLLFYGIGQNHVHAMILRCWREGGLLRGLLTGTGILLTVIIVTVLILTAMIVGSAFKKPAPDANVIVLGCEVKGERPSRMLTARMDAAVDYLQQHPDLYCVLSGGKGENEKISEAECMFRYMTARGIAPERLIKEDRSISTRENIRFSLQKLREAGLVPDSGGGDTLDIAIVTNEFHACRAGLIAKESGVNAGFVLAASVWWLLPAFYVRELYGLLYQIFL